jgi:two-component system, OmpR family, response regulator RegX3
VAERILIADDEPALLDAVSYALDRAGFDPARATTGEDALEHIRHNPVDVVILDVMLPGRSGFDVCRELRAGSDIPIILLTAREAEADRVAGLELGADDYITKPFSMAELVSRVRAILRRRALDREAASGAARLTVGEIGIEPVSGRVTIAGRAVRLTPSEYQILLLMAGSPGTVLTRRQILRHLWDSEHVGDERVCDVHVHSLRRKLEGAGGEAGWITTVRGQGYVLSG